MSRFLDSSPDINIHLHDKQGLVLQSSAQEILYGGAAGGGKSHLLRVASIIWAMQIPGIQIYLFRRQFGDLEKNHLAGPSSYLVLLGTLMLQGLVKWHATKYKFIFWNGSVINLCHCQKEDDRFDYLGAEIHVLLVDEMSQFTPKIINFLRTRVRMVGIPIPEGVVGTFPRIVYGSNPGGPCHNYMKRGWVDCAPERSIFRAPESDGGMTRQFIRALVKDNPTLEDQDPMYRNRIKGLGDPALVKAYLEGDFNVITGGMFDDVWSPNFNVIMPFSLPKDWYYDRAFDWGSAKPYAVGFFAESNGSRVTLANGQKKTFPPGSLFMFGEMYGTNGNPDEGLRETPETVAGKISALERLIRRPIMPGPADTAIFDKDVYDNSIAGAMESSHNISWTEANKSPGSRLLGIQKMRSMLWNAQQTPQELPGLYIFQNNFNTIRTVPVLQRDEDRVEDIAKGQEDHAFDMIRYRAMAGSSEFTGADFRII